MNFQVDSSGAGFLAFLAILWGLFITIFWMIVGWRAMRAHERIAESIDRNLHRIASEKRSCSNPSEP